MLGIWCSVSVAELELSFVNAHCSLALQDAHDWAVSRSRFWGTPIPIWVSEDGEEVVVIGSKQQLEELSGHKVRALLWNASVQVSKRNLHVEQDRTPLMRNHRWMTCIGTSSTISPSRRSRARASCTGWTRCLTAGLKVAACPTPSSTTRLKINSFSR